SPSGGCPAGLPTGWRCTTRRASGLPGPGKFTPARPSATLCRSTIAADAFVAFDRQPPGENRAMVEIDVGYQGQLRCEARHGPSGQTVLTDAPVDNHGRGESFSPTDLVATALGTCMLTIMGIV